MGSVCLSLCACARSEHSTLKAHLNVFQEAGAPPLRGVCWYFTLVLLDAETQLLHATGLVVVDAVPAGSPKPESSDFEVRTVSLGDDAVIEEVLEQLQCLSGRVRWHSTSHEPSLSQLVFRHSLRHVPSKLETNGKRHWIRADEPYNFYWGHFQVR